jgi:hypothetical protein
MVDAVQRTVSIPSLRSIHRRRRQAAECTVPKWNCLAHSNRSPRSFCDRLCRTTELIWKSISLTGKAGGRSERASIMMRKIVMATIRSTTDSMFSWRPNTRALAGSYQESTTDPSSITGLDITDLGAWARAANPQQSQNAEGGTASAGSLAFASTDPDIERPARRKGPCGHGTHARHGLCYRAQTNLVICSTKGESLPNVALPTTGA